MLSEEVRDRLAEILPAIMSINDIVHFLEVDHLTIRRLIWDKELPAYMTDGEWNINRGDFLVFLSKNSSL